MQLSIIFCIYWQFEYSLLCNPSLIFWPIFKIALSFSYWHMGIHYIKYILHVCPYLYVLQIPSPIMEVAI